MDGISPACAMERSLFRTTTIHAPSSSSHSNACPNDDAPRSAAAISPPGSSFHGGMMNTRWFSDMAQSWMSVNLGPGPGSGRSTTFSTAPEASIFATLTPMAGASRDPTCTAFRRANRASRARRNPWEARARTRTPRGSRAWSDRVLRARPLRTAPGNDPRGTSARCSRGWSGIDRGWRRDRPPASTPRAQPPRRPCPRVLARRIDRSGPFERRRRRRRLRRRVGSRNTSRRRRTSARTGARRRGRDRVRRGRRCR